jgi:aspartyl/asparaginyl-tRNA synthetase
LQKSTTGTAVNTGLVFLSAEASKLGINIAQGEYINVEFDITGTIADPKVAMKMLASDGQSTISEQATNIVSNVTEKAKDTLTTLANKELDKAKEKAKEAADKAADSIRNVANRKVQEVTDQAKEKLGKEVGDKLGKEAEKVLGDQGQKKIDEVKDKLDKWDPFKKKKKDN